MRCVWWQCTPSLCSLSDDSVHHTPTFFIIWWQCSPHPHFVHHLMTVYTTPSLCSLVLCVWWQCTPLLYSLSDALSVWWQCTPHLTLFIIWCSVSSASLCSSSDALCLVPNCPSSDAQCLMTAHTPASLRILWSSSLRWFLVCLT